MCRSFPRTGSAGISHNIARERQAEDGHGCCTSRRAGRPPLATVGGPQHARAYCRTKKGPPGAWGIRAGPLSAKALPLTNGSQACVCVWESLAAGSSLVSQLGRVDLWQSSDRRSLSLSVRIGRPPRWAMNMPVDSTSTGRAPQSLGPQFVERAAPADRERLLTVVPVVVGLNGRVPEVNQVRRQPDGQ